MNRRIISLQKGIGEYVNSIQHDAERGRKSTLLTDVELGLLRDLFREQRASKQGVNSKRFRAKHEEYLGVLSDLVAGGWIEDRDGTYSVQLVGIAQLTRVEPLAESLIYLCAHMYDCLRREYKADPERKIFIRELQEIVDMPIGDVRKALPYLRQANLFAGYTTDLQAADAYVVLAEELIRYRSFGEILDQRSDWATRQSRERSDAIRRAQLNKNRSANQPRARKTNENGKVAKVVLKSVRTPLETYKLLRKLGQGGTGLVMSATNEAGVQVALKYLQAAKKTETVLKRFRNEIRFGLSIRHRNIVPILDVGEGDFGDGATLFFIMPVYPLTLRQAMDRALLSPGQAVYVFGQLLAGIQQAHESEVWHRDLKPENVLLSDDLHEVKICDFGIAHFSETKLYSLAKTKAGDRLANFKYAAPEQRDRNSKKDHRVDIFALGLILNEMITGEVPHGSGYRQIREVDEKLARLDDLVAKMIQQQPDKRPQSVDLVRKELESYVEVERKLDKDAVGRSIDNRGLMDTRVASTKSPLSTPGQMSMPIDTHGFKAWLHEKREKEEIQRRTIRSVLEAMEEVGPLTPDELARLSPIGIQDLEEMGFIEFSKGRWTVRKNA